MPVHHRLRFLTFPMRTSRLCSLWPDMRPLRFRRVPFGRDVAFDPGGATASRIAMPHMLPSTVPSVSASAKLLLSWLNPPPHPITVYASHPPSPTTAQHSLPGGALPPYRGRSFTGRIASASPDAPEREVRIQLPHRAKLKDFRHFWRSTVSGFVSRDGSDFCIPDGPTLGTRVKLAITTSPGLNVTAGVLDRSFGAAAIRFRCLSYPRIPRMLQKS